MCMVVRILKGKYTIAKWPLSRFFKFKKKYCKIAIVADLL